MARLRLTDPPQLAGGDYTDYRPWLDSNFYFRLCSYCLLPSKGLAIDHYEPRKLAPARLHDPHNLLLSCPDCNGPAGKWDYHPRHAKRVKWRADQTGHLVLDVRSDDLGALYEVLDDGDIVPRPGGNHKRAVWNISLLKLDLRAYKQCRALNLDFLRRSEEIVLLLSDPDHTRSHEALSTILLSLVRYLAEHRPFFLAFGLSMSPALQSRVDAAAREAVEPLATAASSAQS